MMTLSFHHRLRAAISLVALLGHEQLVFPDRAEALYDLPQQE
jgi:hypothetical protein